MLGLFVAHIAAFNLERPLQDQYGYLLLAALPAFLVGITEDVTKQVGVQTRLAITMVAASCGAWLMNGIISRIDVPLIDELLRWTPLAVAFTVFSVAGVANAMNIIDGYNGLAAGYGLIVLLALGYVSFQVGDGFLVLACTGMIGALCGFLAFNYPKGKIFLGDSGAYTLGFWLAEISVLLVTRHSDVSPWFPVALLIYPVFETLFSIYRRKLVRGSSPGHPDRLHMHQMIYMRLVRGFLGRTDRDLLTRRNSLVAPYIWGVAVLLVVSAVSAWRHTLLLCLIICSFCACYVRVYSQVVHWRTPSWLIVRERIKG
jgi:UDP-N-acetylmuramyl pentapeptide phosphotransferase/UDP-N-acetylglucosamine-1-phosphate transferase